MLERSVEKTFEISIYSLIITRPGVNGKKSSSQIAVTRMILSMSDIPVFESAFEFLFCFFPMVKGLF